MFQVYAQPTEYWKNYYNLFDFVVLIISVAHEILQGVELGGSGITILRVAAGWKEFKSFFFSKYYCSA